MNPRPRSWTASIVGFALAVLVVCFALKLAASYLLAALPVLLPAIVIAGTVAAVWSWWSGRPRGW